MINVEYLLPIFIGRKLDGGVEKVEINCTSWCVGYPQLTNYRIEVTTPNGVIYFPEKVKMQDNVLVWEIEQSDTAETGKGAYQVVATGADGKRKTSNSAALHVLSIMPGTAQESPPDPAKSWTDKVTADAEKAATAAENAEKAASRAENAADALPGVVADYLSENPPEDGISPLVTVSDIDGGHRVTITDKDGEKQFDVMDGKDGQGGGASVQADLEVNDESDPAYVKNRTHWMERPYEPIVWDGSTEGRDSIDLSLAMGYPAGSVVAYKISDHVLTANEMSASKVHVTLGGDLTYSGELSATEQIPNALWMATYDVKDEIGYDFYNGTLIVTAIAGDFTSELGAVIPSTGTYSLPDTTGHSVYIDINADTYHTLDSRYLPESYATKEYVDGLITGAIGGSY